MLHTSTMAAIVVPWDPIGMHPVLFPVSRTDGGENNVVAGAREPPDLESHTVTTSYMQMGKDLICIGQPPAGTMIERVDAIRAGRETYHRGKRPYCIKY